MKVATRNRREYRQKDLNWDGLRLRLNSGRLLATVEPDSEWPGMYRVLIRDGHPTDMTNLSWSIGTASWASWTR